jgi:hypothetical protein
MRVKELNRATIGVVSSTDMRGRATADKIRRGLRNKKNDAFGASLFQPFWDT